MERVDKLLANSGRWSRKEARGLIQRGRVMIQGRVVKDIGEKCLDTEPLYVDGERILTHTHVYLMLNKPQGVVSSTEDPRDKTVLELLPEANQRQGLFPVGRLDKDTEGLLLLTNDGPLAHHLLSPRHHIEKVYEARVDGALDQADVEAFAAGMQLGDGTICQKARLDILSVNHARVTICEGKYHQVKRMLAARGKPVQFLKRIAMGTMQLEEDLALGAFRYLTADEVEQLKL